MVRGLGAEARVVSRPFNPEGGAYGQGAVHGHSHSHGLGTHHQHHHDH
jgi:urease accessory protein